MNRALILAATVGLILTRSGLRAQEPFVYETPTELTSVLNLNGDALADLVIADRQTGALRFGTSTSTGGVTWQTQLTGVTPLDSLAIGAPASGQNDSCAITGSLWNAVEIITPSTAGQRSLRVTGHTISALAPRSGPADVGLNQVFISSSVVGSSFLLANQISTDQEIASTPQPSLRAGNSIRLNPSSRVSVMINEATQEAQLWQLNTVPSAAFQKIATRTGLPAQARLAEVPIISGASTHYHLAYWAPGGATFSLSRIVTSLTAPTMWSFDPPQSISTNGLALGSLHFLAATGTGNQDTLLLLISADGLTARTVVLPSGGTTLTLRQSFSAPVGQTFTGALAQANGGFHFLQGKNGRTVEVQFMAYNGSTHTPGPLTPLPSLSGTRTSANVFTFTAEPFVDQSATFTRSFKVRDWTVTATNNAGTLSVSALQDSGPTSGLGSAATVSVSGATSGHFAVPNQIRPDVSLAVLGTSFGPPRDRLIMDPPSGRYQPLTNVSNQPFFPIRFQNEKEMREIYFRLNNGSWLKYDPNATDTQAPAANATTGRPVLAASGTVEAFGVPVGTELPTPSTRHTYQLAGTGPLAASPVVDTDGNGLSDAWEKAFGLTDANGDADGDGFSNRDEYVAGTDPRNQGSVPTSTGELPILYISGVTTSGSAASAEVEIFWFSPRSDLILESSTTLKAPWTTISSAQITTNAQRHAYRYSVSSGARFFRLRRP